MQNQQHLKVVIVKGEKRHPGQRTQKDIENILRNVHKGLAHHPDILLLPEYALYGGKPELQDNNPAVRKILEWSKQHPQTLIIPGTYIKKEGEALYNRTAVIKGGKILQYHDKQHSSGFDRDMGGQHGLPFSSRYTNPVVEHEEAGLTVGIETCIDHCPEEKPGVLRKHLEETGREPVDIHCITAHQVDHTLENIMAKDQGYLVTADSFQDAGYKSSVHRVNRTKQGWDMLEEVKPDKETTDILVYRLPVKVQKVPHRERKAL
ncbi:hypothetical protein HYS48_03815 [Candidatus Woesearchaeota archaeon]|nr:hypothetical protein [Candidatus Woesearchaeota archaeon]